MNKFVRNSKYRHVFANTPKRDENWDGIRLTKSAWDSNWASASSKYLAVSWATGGGGAVGILDAHKPGKLEPTKVPLISGHKGAILDLQFDPFSDNILATCSEDCTAKIWKIPEEGMADGTQMTESLQTLNGHKRKVGTVAFHPIVENCIATGAQDYLVNVWDIETGQAKLSTTGHTAIIQSLDWNYDGSLMCTNAKDKKVRIVDPRQQTVAAEAQAHVGVKGGRALWLGKHEKFLSVGFGTGASRQYFIWDPKKMDTPLLKQNLDSSSGVIMPFYDEDADLIFFVGKGDGNIRYYEIDAEAEAASKMVFPITAYSSNDPQSGCCMLPRRHCDTSQNEIIRLYKVTPTQIRPLRFKVPRKSDLFQDDLFPPCRGDTPNNTMEAWLSGTNATPNLFNLEDGFVARAPTEKVVQKVEDKKELTPKEMKAKVEELEKKVAYLEAEMIKRDAKIKELEG